MAASPDLTGRGGIWSFCKAPSLRSVVIPVVISLHMEEPDAGGAGGQRDEQYWEPPGWLRAHRTELVVLRDRLGQNSAPDPGLCAEEGSPAGDRRLERAVGCSIASARSKMPNAVRESRSSFLQGMQRREGRAPGTACRRLRRFPGATQLLFAAWMLHFVGLAGTQLLDPQTLFANVAGTIGNVTQDDDGSKLARTFGQRVAVPVKAMMPRPFTAPALTASMIITGIFSPEAVDLAARESIRDSVVEATNIMLERGEVPLCCLDPSGARPARSHCPRGAPLLQIRSTPSCILFSRHDGVRSRRGEGDECVHGGPEGLHQLHVCGAREGPPPHPGFSQSPAAR